MKGSVSRASVFMKMAKARDNYGLKSQPWFPGALLTTVTMAPKRLTVLLTVIDVS
jgi:hypothetical protein